ncbi:hypothetical protein SNK03_010970 [Fusarium graminearum]|nr:hypothetical protein HG531_003616 [Fusarium graminearum]
MLAPSKRPPLPALARQRELPRSMTLLSHSRLDCATQLREEPPMMMHAATGLAVGSSASILLQAGVGNTACSVGNRSVVVLATDVDSAARSVANTLNVQGASRGNGSEAENKGGERELHLEFVEGEEEVVCLVGWL